MSGARTARYEVATAGPWPERSNVQIMGPSGVRDSTR